MIVFRKQERLEDPQYAVNRIVRLLEAAQRDPSHANIVELVIEYGEFESAAADVLLPEKDDIGPEIAMLRETALLLGRIFCKSWMLLSGPGKTPAARRGELAELFARSAAALRTLSRPDFLDSMHGSICLRFSEGFAHYGIFPETYVEAARKFFAEDRPASATCIGLRSIGACLSSIVGAALAELGCTVRALTVRPRGHPYDRYVKLAAGLEEYLLRNQKEFFVIVDEGPGLSGSSFASIAEHLRRLRIPDDKIVLFPCWEPDGSEFFSETAMQSWRRLKKCSATFEDTWTNTGRLAEGLPYTGLADISAGNWRQLICGGNGWPAVHPHHEQRKYICSGHQDSRGGAGQRFLVKFAGLGRYGKKKFQRARNLADANFSMPAAGIANGFIISSFAGGRPLAAADLSAALIERMAQYLAFLKTRYPAEPDLSAAAMLQMVEINAGEGLGKAWARKTGRLAKMKGLLEGEAAEIDGRMLPHEWILSEGRYLKADALDHHADQFFPKRQDIAWDIAGAAVEFGMDRAQIDFLLDRYAELSLDRSAAEKLPLYSICYLAYRLGYSALAEQSLTGTTDGRMFGILKSHYAKLLKKHLSAI
ncbi:MAG: hypothetical protein ABFD62_05365 [Syntrophaceae bacterium]